MSPNPLIERKYIFFRTARVILHDELFLRLLKDRRFSFVVAISHAALNPGNFVDMKRKTTTLIELNRPPEYILQSFHDTTRNEIRRTFSMVELSFTQDDNRFEDAYALYRTFRRKKHLPLQSRTFLKSAVRFSAYWKNSLVSVVTMYDADPYLRIQNIFSLITDDKDLRRISGFATRRLIYEACVYGSNRGRKFLDLASVNLHNPAKAGISKFKLSFGGNIADEYTYTYKSSAVRILSSIKKFSDLIQWK